ncbi:MAG: hypothetical protein HZY76_13185 [Anaerolineae bacterium]|nr:MAG: hypothetical protein HZY76_13185 [Anaerolineae bacterium]
MDRTIRTRRVGRYLRRRNTRAAPPQRPPPARAAGRAVAGAAWAPLSVAAVERNLR